MIRKDLVENYELIPMSEITEEAKAIAVLWVEGFEPMGFDIQQKHKLASDIMNYAKSQLADRDAEIAKLKATIESIKKDLDKAIADIDKAYGH